MTTRPFLISWFTILLLATSLSGCRNYDVVAPVVNGWQQNPARESDYVVQKDDTIYSIAWAFDLDYRDLAVANNLTPPYRLVAGQRLKMSTAPRVTAAHPTLPPKPKEPVTSINASSSPKLVHSTSAPTATLPVVEKKTQQRPPKETQPNVGKWIWPTKGRVIDKYSPVPGANRGIDIAGTLNQPIVAASSGKVVYSGTGLRGYGKLLIIKHSDSFLSAYAFNQSLLVKEGAIVKTGQKIATMGRQDGRGGKVMLHFEIRKDGKPVNPLSYLPPY